MDARGHHADFLGARALINVTCDIEAAHSNEFLAIVQAQLDEVWLPLLLCLVEALLNLLIERLLDVAQPSLLIHRFLAGR